MHIRGERVFKRLYVCAALVLFSLYGCGVWDPTDYGVGTRYFTIIFDGNGNTSGNAPASIVRMADGSTITLPGQGSLARTNYTFGWWRTTGRYSSETADYYPGDTYSVKRSLTFYAKWIPIYTVQFDGNGVTNGVPTAVQADSGKSITLPAALTRPGYDFSGWSGYQAGSSYIVTNNITLDAKWTFTDSRDGKTYKTVTIGGKAWMAENLNYDTAGGSGSWCYGDADSNCVKYGRLYDWNTAMAGALSSSANPSGVRGVCPSGWHLPSRAEWNTLVDYVGGSAGKKLKSTSGWNGTDNFGFSALPGGGRYSDGSFYLADGLHWWSATESDSSRAYIRGMGNKNDDVYEHGDVKGDAYSVRCLQN